MGLRIISPLLLKHKVELNSGRWVSWLCLRTVLVGSISARCWWLWSLSLMRLKIVLHFLLYLVTYTSLVSRGFPPSLKLNFSRKIKPLSPTFSLHFQANNYKSVNDHIPLMPFFFHFLYVLVRKDINIITIFTISGDHSFCSTWELSPDCLHTWAVFDNSKCYVLNVLNTISNVFWRGPGVFGWLSTLGSEFVTITEMFFHLEVCQSNQHSLPKNKLVLFFFSL